MNVKQEDVNICNEFTEEFRSVFQINTFNSDDKFKAELQECFMRAEDDTNCTLVAIDLLTRCMSKMKLNKSPGLDNVSAEHLIYAGCDLQVHLCLLYNSMVKRCHVPCAFCHGLIIPLLKDKRGDQTKLDMSRCITVSPTIAKLFEYVLMECYGDQLTSDKLQFGFKKHSGGSHAPFTFKQKTKYFIKKGRKIFYCAFVDASKVLTRCYTTAFL